MGKDKEGLGEGVDIGPLAAITAVSAAHLGGDEVGGPELLPGPGQAGGGL